MAVPFTKIGNTGEEQVGNEFSSGLVESDVPAGHPEKDLQLVTEEILSKIRRDIKV